MEPCDECHGSGIDWMDGLPCTWCSGTGTINPDDEYHHDYDSQEDDQ